MLFNPALLPFQEPIDCKAELLSILQNQLNIVLSKLFISQPAFFFIKVFFFLDWESL